MDSRPKVSIETMDQTYLSPVKCLDCSLSFYLVVLKGLRPKTVKVSEEKWNIFVQDVKRECQGCKSDNLLTLL